MFQMTQGDLVALAKATAIKYGLDPALICAICEQESGKRDPDPATQTETWEPWAIRYEPAFQKRYVDPLGLSATESVARSISFGLMQTMGQSVREVGFGGHLASLCDPPVGIEWGCKLFKAKLNKANSDTRVALGFWNGGSNLLYPNEVIARVPKYASQS